MSYFSFLRTFLAVYRCGSYNKASGQLSLTQPAISKQIASLEQQLNKKLFKRDGRGMEPTAVADELAHAIASHVDALELIFNQSRLHSDEAKGTIHIGGPKEFIHARMIPVFVTLTRHHINTVLQVGDPLTSYQLIHENILDLAITEQPSKASDIGCRKLFTCDLVLLASPSWAAKLETASPQTLADIPLLIYEGAASYVHQYFIDVFQDDAITRPSIMVEDLNIIHSLLCEGAGYSVLPEYLIQDNLQSGNLVQLFHPEQPPRHVLYLLWNKFSTRSKRTVLARDAILKEAKSW